MTFLQFRGGVFSSDAPVLSVSGGSAADAPETTLAFLDLIPSGSTITYQYDDNSGFTSPTETAHVVTVAEAIAQIASLGVLTLPNGVLYIRAKSTVFGEDSSWSNTINVTVNSYPPPLPETFFDSANKGSGITIGVGNKTITKSGTTHTGAGVGTTGARTTGFRYFEIVTDSSTDFVGMSVFLTDDTQSLTGTIFAGSTTFIHAGSAGGRFGGCYGGHATPASGTRWWDGTDYANEPSGLSTASAGSVIGVAIDIATGKFWMRCNGTWGASAVPVANGSDWHFIDRTPPASGYRIGVAMYGDTSQMTLRTKVSEFTGSLPTGAIAWDDEL